MSCFQIIPEISVADGKAIVQGRAVNCAELAHSLYMQGADGILLNNVDKTMPGIAAMFRSVSEVSDRVFLPLRVSGAIYETAQIKIYITDGADRVYYNSNGIRFPQYINDSVKKLGAHYVGAAIDCRKNQDMDIYQAYVGSGKISAGKDATLWVHEAIERGVKDVLLNVMSASEFDEGEIKEFMTKIGRCSAPLFLRGSFSKKEHFALAHSLGVIGVVSSAFAQGTADMEGIKKQLSEMKINVR